MALCPSIVPLRHCSSAPRPAMVSRWTLSALLALLIVGFVSIFQYLRPYWRTAVATAHSSILINIHMLDSGFIRTIVFCIMAKDLYTGYQPVFSCPLAGEDAIGLKTHSCKGSSSGLMLVGRRNSIQKSTPVVPTVQSFSWHAATY
jgi:hypothetical protein